MRLFILTFLFVSAVHAAPSGEVKMVDHPTYGKCEVLNVTADGGANIWVPTNSMAGSRIKRLTKEEMMGCLGSLKKPVTVPAQDIIETAELSNTAQ